MALFESTSQSLRPFQRAGSRLVNKIDPLKLEYILFLLGITDFYKFCRPSYPIVVEIWLTESGSLNLALFIWKMWKLSTTLICVLVTHYSKCSLPEVNLKLNVHTLSPFRIQKLTWKWKPLIGEWVTWGVVESSQNLAKHTQKREGLGLGNLSAK